MRDTNTVWEHRFLDLARSVASWSKDPSTHVGAVIVDSANRILSLGYNGFPAGMSDDRALYQDRTEKYSRIIHAEMNALLHMAGPITETMTLYTWPLPPCDRCMIHYIQAGLRRVVSLHPSPAHRERWGESNDRAIRYLREVGGSITYLE